MASEVSEIVGNLPKLTPLVEVNFEPKSGNFQSPVSLCSVSLESRVSTESKERKCWHFVFCSFIDERCTIWRNDSHTPVVYICPWGKRQQWGTSLDVQKVDKLSENQHGAALLSHIVVGPTRDRKIRNRFNISRSYDNTCCLPLKKCFLQNKPSIPRTRSNPSKQNCSDNWHNNALAWSPSPHYCFRSPHRLTVLVP